MVVSSQDDSGVRAALCEALALRTGGTVLSTQALAAAEMASSSEDGRQMQALQSSGKIVPVATLVKLLLRAMGSSRAPYVLSDFPRMAAQLKQLEASVGAVACFVQLPGALDRPVEAMVSRLRGSGRVHQLGAADATEAAAVLQRAGLWAGGGAAAPSPPDVAALPAPVVEKLAKVVSELGLQWQLPQGADAVAAVAAANKALSIDGQGSLEQQVEVLWQKLRADMVPATPARTSSHVANIAKHADGSFRVSIKRNPAQAAGARLPAAEPATAAPAAVVPAPPPLGQALSELGAKTAVVVSSQDDSGARAALCEALALRTGGTVLSTQALAAAEMASSSEDGRQMQALQSSGKIVPVATLVKLLLRAMGSSRAPYVLSDFPRMAAQLKQLEASVGAVACFVQLPGALDRPVEAMVSRLRGSGRVHQLGAADATEAAAVLQRAGLWAGGGPPSRPRSLLHAQIQPKQPGGKYTIKIGKGPLPARVAQSI